MIASRIIYQKRRVVAVLGLQHAKQYTSVIAIVIESAALYSLVSIVFLVLYGLNHPVQFVFLETLPQIEVLGPSFGL